MVSTLRRCVWKMLFKLVLIKKQSCQRSRTQRFATHRRPDSAVSMTPQTWLSGFIDTTGLTQRFQWHRRPDSAVSMTPQTWLSGFSDTADLTQQFQWHRRPDSAVSLTLQTWLSGFNDTADLTHRFQWHCRPDSAVSIDTKEFLHVQISPRYWNSRQKFFSIRIRGLGGWESL